MSPIFRFSKTNVKHRNHPARQGIFQKLNFKRKIFVFSIILFVSLSGFYLFQINDLAVKGFEIRNLEEKIKELKQENKNLELKTAELQTLSNIEELKKELNLVKAGQAEYISETAVTARR